MKAKEIDSLYQDFYELKMDWEEAMQQAKDELGYGEGEYIEDFGEVVDLAKDIQQEEYEEFYSNLIDLTQLKHKEYLKSERWLKLRLKILERDKNFCRDCNNKAVEVHHLDYSFLGTEEEKNYCISICRDCHLNRHGIKR